MTQIVQFELSEIMPERDAVFRQQGVPTGAPVRADLLVLAQRASALFISNARPQGLIIELPASEFEQIFISEGRNEPDAVVALVYPRAEHLALFTLTMGKAVSESIEELFNRNEFALATMLDAVASLAADAASEVCETYFLDHLTARRAAGCETRVLSYSPGYCGWDITGQRTLFQFLQPEKIGVTLNESCLMNPIKSISGVLIAGNKDAHRIDAGSYPYCNRCNDQSCFERIKRRLDD